MLVNIDIKGKGIIQNKTMKVEGSHITIEGLAGAWFWIKKEGCFKLKNTIYHNGDFDPDKEILCSIIPAEGEKLEKFSHSKITLNEIEFEKYETGEEDIEEDIEEETPPIEASDEQEHVEDEVPEEADQPIDEANKKELEEIKIKVVELEKEKTDLEDEMETLKLEVRQHEITEKGIHKKLHEAKQRILNITSEKNEFENQTAELKIELEHKEKAEEAYKNQIEEIKAELNDNQNEYKLTIQTYEKTLRDRKETFTKINKWMSKVAGMDEKVNPNEKAAWIEKLVLERWDILEENKKLKESLDKPGMAGLAKELPPQESADSDTPDIDEERDEKLEKAFKYVVISIHMSSNGDQYKTLDRIDNILNRFHVIDPEEEGLSEKDLLVVRDIFDARNREYEPSESQDVGTMVNFFKDEIEIILELPEFTDPYKRVAIRQELREYFDEYNPKASR